MVDNLKYESHNEMDEADLPVLPHFNTDEIRQILEFPEENSNFPTPLFPYIVEPFQFPNPNVEHWNKLPVMDEIESDIQFNVNLPGETSGKNSWMYSSKLKKVFIKMCKSFTVDITFVSFANHGDLFLRAMIVYSSSEDLHLPVNRCHNHENQSEINQQIHESVLPHILRCKRKETIYCGVKTGENFGERLAILIPLGITKIGAVTENINFEFVCQNSCGMNRKSTAVIFTLENSNSEILGKRIMNFKVCSCPRRDREKEEESHSPDMPTKRKSSEQNSSKKSKKICVKNLKKEPETDSPPETTYVELCVSLPDNEIAMHVLKCAFNAVTGKMATDKNNTEKYLPFMKEIKKKMDAMNCQNVM